MGFVFWVHFRDPYRKHNHILIPFTIYKQTWKHPFFATPCLYSLLAKQWVVKYNVNIWSVNCPSWSLSGVENSATTIDCLPLARPDLPPWGRTSGPVFHHQFGLIKLWRPEGERGQINLNFYVSLKLWWFLNPNRRTNNLLTGRVCGWEDFGLRTWERQRELTWQRDNTRRGNI